MADTVKVRALVDDGRQHVVHLTCKSDATGESAVVKVDRSAIADAIDGAEAASLDIEAVRWAVQGFSSVTLLWDRTADDVALRLSGNGYEDFVGPSDIRALQAATLADPRSAGGTGDILLTSEGAVDGATYDITLWLRKAAS